MDEYGHINTLATIVLDSTTGLMESIKSGDINKTRKQAIKISKFATDIIYETYIISKD